MSTKVERIAAGSTGYQTHPKAAWCRAVPSVPRELLPGRDRWPVGSQTLRNSLTEDPEGHRSGWLGEVAPPCVGDCGQSQRLPGRGRSGRPRWGTEAAVRATEP